MYLLRIDMKYKNLEACVKVEAYIFLNAERTLNLLQVPYSVQMQFQSHSE